MRTKEKTPLVSRSEDDHQEQNGGRFSVAFARKKVSDILETYTLRVQTKLCNILTT
jgi:hypothetical protein